MSGFMMTVCMDGSICISIVTSAPIVYSIESALLYRSLDKLVRQMPVAGQDATDDVIKTACRFEEKIFHAAIDEVSPHFTAT